MCTPGLTTRQRKKWQLMRAKKIGFSMPGPRLGQQWKMQASDLNSGVAKYEKNVAALASWERFNLHMEIMVSMCKLNVG